MSKMKETHSDIAAALAAIPDPAPYFRKLIGVGDAKSGEKKAQDYCAANAETVVGAERRRLQAEIASLKERGGHQKDAIEKQRKLLDKTDRTITEYDKRMKEEPDAERRDVRKYLDYALACVCAVLGCTSVSASMAAMYTLVTSAGILAIVENPNLAWPFCVPLGLGAIALEFFKRTLKTRHAKRVYARIVYGVCGALMAAWIILAAKIFGGMAGQDFDPAMLLEGSGEDPLMSVYTTVQLFLEFFIGCTLFMTAGDVIGKHSRTREADNPDYLNGEILLKRLEADYAVTEAALIEKETRLHAIDCAVALYVEKAMADYRRLRAQLTD